MLLHSQHTSSSHLAGIDVNLKDEHGKTALAMLSDFPARKARVIHRLISDYIEARRKPKVRYMKPRSYRVIAVPVKDGRGEKETNELPVLHYQEGECWRSRVGG